MDTSERIYGECIAYLEKFKESGKPWSRSELEQAVPLLVAELKDLELDDLEAEVSAELSHLAKDFFDEEKARRDKIFHYTRFVEEDIRLAFDEALERAARKKRRTVASLERIASETSVEINQVLLRAKKEFHLFGLEGSAKVDPEVTKALEEKVAKLEEIYSIEEISSVLAEKLGIPFVDQLREELQHAVAQAMAGGKKQGDLAPLVRHCQSVIESALSSLEERFPNEKIRTQISEEISHLAGQYTEVEVLAQKFPQ